VSFFESEYGHLQGAQLTHENMTAGMVAVRALLPPSHALSSLDTIVSAYNLGTAYGRAIAYTAMFEGTSFATLHSSKLFHVEERESRMIQINLVLIFSQIHQVMT
jgi:long-chain acyl-CoA synthetase